MLVSVIVRQRLSLNFTTARCNFSPGNLMQAKIAAMEFEDRKLDRKTGTFTRLATKLLQH